MIPTIEELFAKFQRLLKDPEFVNSRESFEEYFRLVASGNADPVLMNNNAVLAAQCVVVILEHVKQMEKEDTMSNYQWRPATQADVGSVARFYNDGEPIYGILSSISKDPAGKYVYVCVPNSCVALGDNAFDHCDIQYNADADP